MQNWNPNYGGKKTQYKKKNRYSQEDGDVVFRILPQPKGKNPTYSSDWSKYHSIHFGYRNTEGKIRPFESSLVKKNKEIVSGDAALDRLNDLKAKLESARSDGSPEMAKLNTLVGLHGVYNIDNGHHMNVIGLDGNIGVLKIRYTAKKALDAEIDRLRLEGVDPLSFEDGRFFVFSRSNKGRETTFKVVVYTEKLDLPGVGKVDKQVSHKVTPEILARLETEGQDLETVAPKVTAEEVAQIVAESDLQSGKSPAIDRILDSRWKKRNTDSPQSSGAQAPKAAVPTQTAALAPSAPLASAPSANTSNAPSAGLSVPATSQAQAIEDLNDEDFFKTIGVAT